MRMGCPNHSLVSMALVPSHAQVGFLKEVLPELCKVRKGGKVPARQNGVCKERKA